MLKDLALLAMDKKENGWRPEDGPKEQLASQVAELLSCKREMVDDYFSLHIDQEKRLLGIPLLLGKSSISTTFNIVILHLPVDFHSQLITYRT